MQPLSVVIITFNEERNIGRCLESVKRVADEIVVVDSFSTDATEAICMKYNAVFFRRPWDDYSSARNFGSAKARHDWILALDADEALSPELQQSVIELKNTWNGGACKFVRLSNYCGKWVRHGGWYPDIKVRIFDRRKMRWQGLLHEDLEGVDKKDAELLRGACHHFSYCSVAEHLKKTKCYAGIFAQEMFDKGKKPPALAMVFNPAARFIRDYLLRLGFLDGRNGLIIAAVTAYGTFLKYRNLRPLKQHK